MDIFKSLYTELPLSKYLWNIVKNSSKAERLACAVALAALVVSVTLIVYFTAFKHEDNGDDDDIAPHEWRITRDMWLAQPFNHSDKSAFLPMMLVVVQHTVSSECHTFQLCAAELRVMQDNFIKDHGWDIPYNFLIGNDGRVYEGRGWNIEGAHTFGYNRCAVGLGFIGDYRGELPRHTEVTESQMNRTRMILDEGVKLNYLRADYQIVGAKDLRDTASPGSILHNALRKWDNFDHQNRFRGLNCEQIEEKFRHVDL